MTCHDDARVSALLLRRASDVLFTCVDSVVRIEDLIMPLAEPAIDRCERASLQEFDLLRQRLGDIATCLARIADCQYRNDPVDAATILAPMQLNDLRSQLMGQDPEVRDPQDDCVLF